MVVKYENGTKDVPLTEVTPENYIVPKGEEKDYHVLQELKNFDRKTGKRLSRPVVQKYDAKVFQTQQRRWLQSMGYDFTVLHDPTEYLRKKAEEAEQTARQRMEAEQQRKAAEREALKEELRKELLAELKAESKPKKEQQEVLNGLTAEQIEAITTLSKNDEEALIGNRFREVYNRLDETIATTTGIARNGDEKTYNYLERAAKAVKAQADKVEGLQTKVQELTNEKARLEKVIQDGTADEQTKKQLAQAQRDLASIKEQFNTLKGEKDSLIEQHTKELLNVRIDNELSQALAGIKLKGDLPEQALNTLIGQTMQHVKGFNPEYVDDGKGGKQLVFKDAQGAILRNPEKGLNPMTAGELLERELKAMGIIDERRAAGGGTEPPKPGAGGGDEPIVITGARTRVEANEMLTQQLLKRGLVNGSKQFTEAMRKAWEDNNVKALPEK